MAPIGAFGFGLFLVLVLIQIRTCSSQGGERCCNRTNIRCDESRLCRCDPGWEGPLCDRCALMPGCVHGSCETPWQCVCESGWGGRFCNKDLLACLHSAPCLNGGTCLMEDSGDLTCLCPEGFHGDRCHLKAGPCHLHRGVCLNGGQCEDQDGFAETFLCRCLSGYSGQLCEEDVDDCALAPCANGATCTDGVNRFMCICAPGFQGRFCSVNVNDCVAQPCANGGRCVDLANGYRCICRRGYGGPICDRRLTLAPANRSERTIKVTVSERGAGAVLSLQQIVTVLTLSTATLALVSLTAALVLQRQCSLAPCWRRWGRAAQTQKV